MWRTIAVVALGCGGNAGEGPTPTPPGDDPDTGSGPPADTAVPTVVIETDPSRYSLLTGFEDGQVRTEGLDAIDWLALEVNLGTAVDDLALPAGLSVYYEDGTSDDRWARLRADPVHDDQVLRLRVNNAVIDAGFAGHTKGRVQTGISWEGADRPTELFVEQQVYLHPDLELLRSYDGDPWWLSVTLAEWWFGRNWQGDDDVSRITPAIAFDEGGLFFVASHDDPAAFEHFWTAFDPDVRLPTGEWFVLSTGYRQGDASTGRFVATMTRADGTTTVLADVTGWTSNPAADPPWGLTDLNPQKIYASDNVVHHVRDAGGVLQIDFDDFGMAARWPAGWP